MFKFLRFFTVCLLLMGAATVQAKQVRVDSLRYWSSPERTRMVFDVSSPAVHQVFLLANPARLVIDFKQTKLLKPLAQPPKKHALFSRVRSGSRNKKDLRVVVDLKQAVTPKSFALKPAKSQGHRLVVDLFAKPQVLANTTTKNKAIKATKTVTKAVTNKARDIIIAIDAGHGGKDPGSVGYKGTKEKDIVLDVSKRLARKIQKNLRVKTILTRDEDVWMRIQDRTRLANDKNGRLFISIHANSVEDRRASGFETYMIGTNKNAAAVRIAARENAVLDLEGANSTKLTDEDLITATMAQSGFAKQSEQFAALVQEEMDKRLQSKNRGVKQAGFYVLMGASMPNVLIAKSTTSCCSI